MMKKQFKILETLVFILIFVIGISSHSQALFIDKLLKGPIVIPAPDFVTTGTVIVKSAGQLLSNATAIKNDIQNQVNNMMRALMAMTPYKLLNKVSDGDNPGMMTITESKRYDIYDIDDMQDAVMDMFFTYPMNADIPAENKFKANRDKFYQDTLLEIYTASIQLQDYLEKDVKSNIEASKEESDKDVKDKNTAASKQAEAYQRIDNLLMVLQKAVALKVQLRAAKAIARQIPPTKTSAQQSSLEDLSPNRFAQLELRSSFQSGGTLPLAFASQADNAAALDSLQSSPQTRSAQNNAIEAIKSLKTVEEQSAEATTTEPEMELQEAAGFATVPESDISHPYTDAADKLAQLDKIAPLSQDVDTATATHNMINSLPSYRSAAEGFNRLVKMHEKSLKQLKFSNQCAINYIGRHFVSPEIVWSGRPLGEDVGNHDLRQGISAWTIQAFETAKAAQINSSSPDDFVVPDVDADSKDYTDLTKQDEYVAELTSQEVTTANAGQTDKQEKESRETNMISWQIGAEASKLLAAEPQKWGTLKKRFTIWNDTKSFYNQYLTGKYENIRSYLKLTTVSDIKAYALANRSSPEASKKVEKTARYKAAEALDNKYSTQLEALKKSRQSALDANKTSFESRIKVLENQKEMLQKQLDEIGKTIKVSNDAIQNKRTEISEGTTATMREKAVKVDSYRNYSVDGEAVIYDIREPDVEDSIKKEVEKNANDKANASKKQNLSFGYGHTIFGSFELASAFIEKPDDLKTEYSKSVTLKKTADTTIPDAQKTVEVSETRAAALNKQIADIDEKISTLKQEMQAAAADINEKFNKQEMDAQAVSTNAQAANEKRYDDIAQQSISSIADGVVSALEAANAAANKKLEVPLPYSGPTRGLLIGNFERTINSQLSDLYAKVDARIDQAKQELSQLGDELYDVSSYEKVVAIHNKMLDDIKALPLHVSDSALNLALTIYLYEKLLPADTTPETEDFFVGSPSKERDLKAPKKILSFNLPPLREIFHFDDVDKQNVQTHENTPRQAKFMLAALLAKIRAKKAYITREDFLNYGGDIPEIWKYMLKDNAFVEKNVNLEDALNRGCSQKSFFRGGNMPCKVKNSSQVLDVDEEGRYIRISSQLTPIAECATLESRNGEIYDASVDLQVKINGKIDNQDYNCAYSELGTLLTADNQNRLSFRPKVREAYSVIIEQQNAYSNGEENKAGDESDEEMLQYSVYGNAIFTKNQFGNFLRIMESEAKQRRAVDETRQENEAVLNKLYETLKEFGFEPSPDFDITKDADYELVRKKLDNIKNQSIASAKDKIDGIDITDNEVAAERVNKYRKIVAALEKDKDEVTSITDAVVDDNGLDEEIKTNNVSEQVLGKYQKESDETMKNLDSINEMPFCAAY